MKHSWKRTLVCSLLLVACLYGSTRELRTLQAMRPAARIEEVLYISSPDFVRRMSLGYSGLAADIYWTRAVQYFGRSASSGRTGTTCLTRCCAWPLTSTQSWWWPTTSDLCFWLKSRRMEPVNPIRQSTW